MVFSLFVGLCWGYLFWSLEKIVVFLFGFFIFFISLYFYRVFLLNIGSPRLQCENLSNEILYIKINFIYFILFYVDFLIYFSHLVKYFVNFCFQIYGEIFIFFILRKVFFDFIAYNVLMLINLFNFFSFQLHTAFRFKLLLINTKLSDKENYVFFSKY